MEIQASRLRARVGPGGEPVLLLDQDRARWDRLLIRRGLAALERAETLGGALGPYTLQAAIAACHARARSAEDTDWPRIVALYDGAGGAAPLAGGRAQPRGGGGDGLRPGGRAGARRRAAPTSRRCATTTCCRACAATCSSASGATPRRGPSSSARPSWRATSASASCSWRGPKRCSAMIGDPHPHVLVLPRPHPQRAVPVTGGQRALGLPARVPAVDAVPLVAAPAQPPPRQQRKPGQARRPARFAR